MKTTQDTNQIEHTPLPLTQTTHCVALIIERWDTVKHCWHREHIHPSKRILCAGLENAKEIAVQCAAAPELLAACKELWSSSEEAIIDGQGCKCSRCKEARNKARAAIAKAEGRAES